MQAQLAPTFQKNFGISKSLFTYLLTNKKHISMQYQDLLSYYKLHFWQGHHILSLTQDSEGIIERNNIRFVVVFLTPRGVIKSNPDRQYQVSFRQAIPEAGLLPYVLIS